MAANQAHFGTVERPQGKRGEKAHLIVFYQVLPKASVKELNQDLFPKIRT